MRKDKTIEPDAEASLEHCTRIPVHKGLAEKLIDKASYNAYRPLWNRRNLVPDTYSTWGKAVVAAVQKYLDESELKPDVLVTFAQPFTDHLIGQDLRKRFGLPWLAHFSDPWVDNPFSLFDSTTYKLNLAMERSVAESADILAFTSQETVDLFYAKYPDKLKEKAAILPQCFDSAQYDDSVPKGRITVRYLGNFYGKRTPMPLIRALLKIKETDPEFLDDISFELVGSGDIDGSAVEQMGLSKELFSIRSSVPYSESLKLMSESDGLLVIDAPAEKSVFLPSKLIDYIGANRPVFGITPAGTAEKLITDLGGEIADPENLDELTAKLRIFIDELRHRRIAETVGWGREDVRRQYSTANVASLFSALLKKIAA